jgi:hypothetical protein
MIYPAFCKLGNASGSTGIIQEGVANNREEVIYTIVFLHNINEGQCDMKENVCKTLFYVCKTLFLGYSWPDQVT